MNLSNVYFIIGTSYAGKSTTVKNLAERHHGIALEENYHDAKLPELDSREFPNLCYTRDLQDWHEFIRRTPDEYVTWVNNVKKECETVELRMIEDLLEKPEAQKKKIFVDTNICIETLHRITDPRHVLVMMAPAEIGINRFFDRPDAEKQFLYRLMLEEPDPQAALDNFREILTRLHSKESYDELLNSGYRVIWRDENRTFEQTLDLADETFGLSSGLRIEKTDRNTPLAGELLSFVENCSWEGVKDHVADMIRNWEFSDWETMFTAVMDGKIVGMASVLKTDYYPLPDVFPWVSCIFVSEEYRGRKISGELIGCANRYLAAQGFDRSYIPSEFTGLYEHYGYRYVRDITNYGGGTDHLFMKELG